MALTEKELKEAQIVSLKDRRLREYQTIWNLEMEVKYWEKKKLEGVAIAQKTIWSFKNEIEVSKEKIEILDKMLEELENEK